MIRYAFVNADNVVVQIISALVLTEEEQDRFLRDYEIIFGARAIVRVDDEVRVWIGGSYDATNGAFSPPPLPEPEPEIVEETTNDDAPIE